MQGSKQKKIIGTLVPVSALSSTRLKDQDQGTFAVGEPFLEWLKKTHQNAWEMLPLCQTQLEPGSSTKRVPSPYKGYGVGLDPKYLSSYARTKKPTHEELEKFTQKNKDWIHDFALFCAFSEQFGTDDWREWEIGLRLRNKEALNLWSNKLRKEIEAHILTQWKLHEEFGELRKKAQQLNILLIGDLPFYLCVKSPLVWANQNIFQLEKDGSMRFVSGIPNVPPSFFGRQVWGHPLYKWEKDNEKNVLSVWKIRVAYAATVFNCVRLDYIKALFEYGVMDTESIDDDYGRGPGASFFEKLITFCGQHKLSVFAEDAGNKIEELRGELDELKIPGIKMLRFAYNEKKDKAEPFYADIAHYPNRSVAYTTTQDTETLVEYLQILSEEQRRSLSNAVGLVYDPDIEKLAKKMRGAVVDSPAKTVIIPIQDWLLTEDRINTPGTEKEIKDPNWRYKVGIPIEKLPLIN